MSGFVYIWFDAKRKMYYVGCHWGDVDDGYICSSHRMRQAYNRRPETFKRRILSIVATNRLDLFMEEQRWLYMIPDNQLGKKYYNLCKNAKHHWSISKEKTLSIKEKISKSRKGISPNFSEEGKQRRLESVMRTKAAKKGIFMNADLRPDAWKKKQSEVSRNNGINSYQEKVGIHSQTAEQRLAFCKEGGKITGFKTYQEKTGLFGRTAEQIKIDASNASKNMLWINDGKVCKKMLKGTQVPDGFQLGRIYKRHKQFNTKRVS